MNGREKTEAPSYQYATYNREVSKSAALSVKGVDYIRHFYSPKSLESWKKETQQIE